MVDFAKLLDKSKAADEPLIVLSDEQRMVLVAVDNGRNVLVTGPAGTGKSTLLKAMTAKYGADAFHITASTGIAAVGVGGVTIHSWAGLGKGEDSVEEIADKILETRGRVYKRIKKATRLAIDEVSMIHATLLDLLDGVLKKVRGNEQPFGGIQLILFGDFLQLPPVSKTREGAQFAFESTAWQRAQIYVAMLTKVFRQADATFADALNRIRVGDLPKDVQDLLVSRYQQADPAPEVEAVTVYTHNEDVDLLNAQRLAELPGEAKVWDAIDFGEPGPLSTLQKNCLAPVKLVLKEGAQVMLLWNLETESGLANGSLGTVIKCEGLHPMVKFTNGQVRTIERKEWTMKLEGAVVASRRQIPLRLAWAITAHKSQGMTLDKIKVHLHRVFDYGQAYVALSRARTLEGLFIESRKPGGIRAHPKAVKFYEECRRIDAPDPVEEEDLFSRPEPCPVCGEPLTPCPGGKACKNGHGF